MSCVENDTCPICYENIGEINRMILECRHIYHTSCGLTWLRTHNTCPTCRTEVYEQPENNDEVELDNITQNIHDLNEYLPRFRSMPLFAFGSDINRIDRALGNHFIDNDDNVSLKRNRSYIEYFDEIQIKVLALMDN